MRVVDIAGPVLAAVCACGRIGFDADTLDAVSDTTPVAPCHDPQDPFGTPEAVPGINDPELEDDDPTLPDNQLELYFASPRPGSLGLGDIWRSTRPTTADPWSAPINVAELNSPEDDSTPEISGDGLTMYLARNTGPQTNHSIFMSTRPDRLTAWRPPVPVPELSTITDDVGAAPSPENLSLALSSTRIGGPLRRGTIFMTTRPTPSDPWSVPAAAMELDAATVEESQPFLSATAIYFHTVGPVEQEIHCASRTGPSSFGPPTPLTELNASGVNTDAWVSPDGRTIYFTRSDEIYTATR